LPAFHDLLDRDQRLGHGQIVILNSQ